MENYNFKFEEQVLPASKDIERRIVFSDGNDIRLAQALKTFLKLNNSKCILLGNEKEVIEKLKEAGVDKSQNIKVIDPMQYSSKKDYPDILLKCFKDRNKTIEKDEIGSLISNNSFYAALMLKNNDADCGVAGSISSTESQMRAIVNVLGGGKMRHSDS